MTPRQKEVLDFIKDHYARYGYAPSYEQICVALGFRSKGGVARIVKCLHERGYIEYRKRKARSIRVVDLQRYV